MYDIEFYEKAAKQIERLDKAAQKRVLQAINQLRDNPYKGKLLTETLRGLRSLPVTAPGAEYRAVYYVVEEDTVCVVIFVGSRERFYQRLTRSWEAYQRTYRIKRR